jgi:protein-S-isoprenylcysteine O-methyltransferase Ste14
MEATHGSSAPAYGLWPLVVINSALFIMFAFSFAKPESKRDWKSLGAFSAFIVALFTEMYGFPLTIYFLAPWLQSRFPGMDVYGHDMGHLWSTLFGWKGDPHFSPFHLASYVFIIWGFWIVASAWPVLHRAIRTKTLAKDGPYAVIRHPQYVGFVLVMFGFLLQWPTLITLAMFPILVIVYWRLSLSEERQVRAEFGEEYERYAANVPRFFPRLFRGDQGKGVRAS